MNNGFQEDVAGLRASAHEELRQGDAARAEHHFLRLLEILPDDAEASQFIAARHLSRGQASEAVALLRQVLKAHPDDPSTLHQLGAARMAAGDLRAAIDDLRRCAALAPRMFVARLRLGIALEQRGKGHEAMLAYFGAVNAAQAEGRWMSDATTAPGLQAAVRHAIEFIDAGRHQWFNTVLEPLRQRYGQSELTRVEECLAIYLGEQAARLPDPRQKPKFLYFPGIPSQPYYPRERFPWLDMLEASTADVQKELAEVLPQARELEAFLGSRQPGDTCEVLRSSGAEEAAWDAYFFYRHGQRYDAHCASCPATTALLDALPLVRIRDHAPETFFSVLRPGTDILAHRGVTNTRLVTHLPLIIPADCALRVGGEIHAWETGRCVTFDDTFEHEAWNHSNETRVVLIMDSWNPDLSEAERAAVTDLVEAIGDFNQASDLLPTAL